MAILRRLPDAENGARVTCVDASDRTWTITQSPTATPARRFTLYRAVDGGFERVRQAASPLDLYEDVDFGQEAAAARHASATPPEDKTRPARSRAKSSRKK